MNSSIKINNPERIRRILQRICESNLQIFLKTSPQSHISIRGTTQYLYANNNPPQMLITKVSARGIEILRDVKNVQIEFSMMSTKVLFSCQLISITGNSLYVSIPEQLVSIERRKNTRYPTTIDNSPYMNLDFLNENYCKPLSMPVVPCYDFLKNRLRVADLSLGGFCVVSDFPIFQNQLEIGKIDIASKMILPMIGEFITPVEIRWVKKVKEHLQGSSGKAHITYKFGIQFLEDQLTNEKKQKILQFINIIDSAQAI